MADFPTDIPLFQDLDPNQTLAHENHGARHNKVHAELAAVIAKVGINGSADSTSVDYKLAHLATDLDALPTVGEMNAAIASAVNTAVAAAKSAMMPVGSFYVNADDSTNPATLLGFGTWVAVTDRVLVGKATSGTFSTIGATLGAETVTLTTAQMPAHSHPTTHYNADYKLNPGGAGAYAALDGDHYSKNRNSGDTGGGGAHNNIQPSLVVYMWKRTA